MAYQDKVVDVTVNLGTQPITTVGFETPMFLAIHSVFPERQRRYLTTDAMIEDGFAAGSPAVRFATHAFAGNFAPQMVCIGRMKLTSTKVDFTGFTNTETVVLNITVDGRVKSIKYNIVGGVATPTDIALGLKTAIDADEDIKDLVTSTATAGVLTLTATQPLSVGKGVGEYKVTNVSDETVATALPEVTNENNDWYFLSTESHSDADIVAAAEYAMTNFRMHVFTSASVDSIAASNVTSSVFDTLHSLGYRSLGEYDPLADIEFTEGCMIGAMAANDPSYGDSLHLKTMPGQVAPKVSETQRVNAWGRNANLYRMMYGTGAFIEGRVSDGQYVDVIRFAHWIKFRLEESVFAYMKRRSDMGLSMKMSDDDLPVLKSVMLNNPINVGIRNGAILTGYDSVNLVSYDPIITIPRRAEIPTNDLANRILNDVKVELVYNNSLHYIKIRVSVLLDRPAGSGTNAQQNTLNTGV